MKGKRVVWAVFLIIALIIMAPSLPVEARPSWWNSAAYAEYNVELRIGTDLVGEGSYKWSLLSSTEEYGTFKIDAKIRVVSAEIKNFTLPLSREAKVGWSTGDLFIFYPVEKLKEYPAQYILVDGGDSQRTYKAVLFQADHNKTWYEATTGILVKGIITYEQVQVILTIKSTNVVTPISKTSIPSEYISASLIAAGIILILVVIIKRRR